MAHEIKGDLLVRRTGDFQRRANEGLIQPADLTAGLTLLVHSHKFQRLSTNDAGSQTVTMPDATTLPEGWVVYIQNFGAVDTIPVVDSAAGALKTLALSGVDDSFCMFILVDNAIAAGVWHIHCLNEPAGAVPRFLCTIANPADWSAASGGFHTTTCLESEHGRGPDPMYQVFETSGADSIHVEVDQSKYNASGDIELQVTALDAEDSDTDARFAGHILVI